MDGPARRAGGGDESVRWSSGDVRLYEFTQVRCPQSVLVNADAVADDKSNGRRLQFYSPVRRFDPAEVQTSGFCGIVRAQKVRYARADLSGARRVAHARDDVTPGLRREPQLATAIRRMRGIENEPGGPHRATQLCTC